MEVSGVLCACLHDHGLPIRSQPLTLRTPNGLDGCSCLFLLFQPSCCTVVFPQQRANADMSRVHDSSAIMIHTCRHCTSDLW
jgi:hypothetical protein